MGGNCSKLKKIDIEEPCNSKNNNIFPQKAIDQKYNEDQFKQNKTISKQLIEDIKKLPQVPENEEYQFDYFDKELEEEYNIIRIQEKIQQYLQRKSLKKYSSIKSNKNTNYESQESTAKSKNLSKSGNNISFQKKLSINTQINEKNNKNKNHDYAINSTYQTQNFDNHQQQQQFYQPQQQIKDSDNSDQIKEEDCDDENDILSQESSFGPELNVDLQYVDAISVQRRLQKLEFLQQQVVNKGEI